MSTELTPLLTASVIFGWASGILFLVAGIYLSEGEHFGHTRSRQLRHARRSWGRGNGLVGVLIERGSVWVGSR